MHKITKCDELPIEGADSNATSDHNRLMKQILAQLCKSVCTMFAKTLKMKESKTKHRLSSGMMIFPTPDSHAINQRQVSLPQPVCPFFFCGTYCKILYNIQTLSYLIFQFHFSVQKANRESRFFFILNESTWSSPFFRWILVLTLPLCVVYIVKLCWPLNSRN